MIVVDVTLYPSDGGPAQRIGSIDIVNTGDGTPTQGNYRATLRGKQGQRIRSIRVEGFPRKRLLAYDLLYRVLREAVGERNSVKKVTARKEHSCDLCGAIIKKGEQYERRVKTFGGRFFGRVTACLRCKKYE